MQKVLFFVLGALCWQVSLELLFYNEAIKSYNKTNQTIQIPFEKEQTVCPKPTIVVEKTACPDQEIKTVKTIETVENTTSCPSIEKFKEVVLNEKVLSRLEDKNDLSIFILGGTSPSNSNLGLKYSASKYYASPYQDFTLAVGVRKKISHRFSLIGQVQTNFSLLGGFEFSIF